MKTYNGTLNYVIGDTPATQILGGFKEGVSMNKNHAEHAILQLMNLVTTYQIKNCTSGMKWSTCTMINVMPWITLKELVK